MKLDRQRRAYLVRHMGEERVAALEKALEEKEKGLLAAGIAYKEAGSLKSKFWGIVGNIKDHEGMTDREKIAKLTAAVEEVSRRIGLLRTTLVDTSTPASKALASLVKAFGKGKETEGVMALKELGDSPGAVALRQIFGRGGAS